MSTRENKETVANYVEQLWNEGRLDQFDDFVAEDVIPHTSGLTDSQSVKEGVAAALNAFPDLCMTIDDELGVDDKVIQRWSIRATHQREFRGIPATGKEVAYSGITIYRLAGGKIAEFWTQADVLGMMQQLGAIPSPGS